MRPRHFRLVDDVVTAEPVPAGTDGLAQELGGLHALVPSKLLVSESEWQGESPGADAALGKAEVPLIASLARIRSEADAALALTGVIELLARRFHISLPCGSVSDDAFTFRAPLGVDFELIAQAIDDSLLGIVRATDLQGALRERCQARVEPIA